MHINKTPTYELKVFNGEKVKYIETSQVIEGVTCEVYEFENDSSKDLGIVTIQPGKSTPSQKVLKGSKTIEGYILGDGELVIQGTNGIKTYKMNGEKFDVEVNIGETMQWKASQNSNLKIYEICYPPYKEGRFENI